MCLRCHQVGAAIILTLSSSFAALEDSSESILDFKFHYHSCFSAVGGYDGRILITVCLFSLAGHACLYTNKGSAD